MWGWDPIGEMWWLFAVGNIAFWALVGLLVLALILRPRGGSHEPPASNALQILEERYARGEIDRDEFLERRSTLTDLPRR
jgi:putative membrane protein